MPPTYVIEYNIIIRYYVRKVKRADTVLINQYKNNQGRVQFMDKYSVIDLFAGVGGLSKSFKIEEFSVKEAYVDTDKEYEIYNQNKVEETEIKRINIDKTTKEKNSIDVLIAKIYFLNFSNQNIIDSKIEFLWNSIRERDPRVILIETLKMNYKCIGEIEEKLRLLNYNVKYKEMNTFDYGNIPYNSSRLYIIAFKSINDYRAFDFPKKISEKLDLSSILDRSLNVEDKYYINKYMTDYIDLDSISEDKIYLFKKICRNKNEHKLFEYDYCPSISNIYWGNNKIFIKDYIGIRELTIEEIFKFKGIDKIIISKEISERYYKNLAKKIGNLVVIKSIIHNIRKVLEREGKLYKDVDNGKIANDKDITNNYNLETARVKVEDKEKNAYINDAVSEEVTGNINNIIIDNLESIKAGSNDASKYHDFIFETFEKIFGKWLNRGDKEKKLNENRKRIDIVFDNMKNEGFFGDLKSAYQIFCPKIIIECKNYSEDIKNPELDQLSGRLSKNISMFGILVCRSIQDKKKIMKQCKDIKQEGKYVMVLCDSDINKMINYYKEERFDQIDNYMRDKFDELIF